MSGLRKTSPPYVGSWLYPSGSELLPSKVTSVRVMFFLEKNVSPLPNGSFLEGYRFWWQFGREGLPSFCWPLKGNLFTDEAKCARFYVSEKNVSPLSCALLSQGVLCFALHVSNDGCRVQGEKRLPPFLACIFQFFRGCF